MNEPFHRQPLVLMKRDLQQLAEAHTAAPTPENRDALVRAALPFVRSLVNRLNVPDTILATREDLEHVGYIGLLQALDAYDTSRTTPFVSYAYGRVRGAVVDYLRSIDTLPRQRRRRLAKAHRIYDDLQQELGDDPTEAQVAEAMDMSLEDYRYLLHLSQRRYAQPLHDPLSAHTDRSLLDTLMHPDARHDFDAIDRRSLHQYVSALIAQLPDRDQTILGLYYYEELRLKDIAELMDLTEARISQILSEIRGTLRAQLSRTEAIAA